ncbi:hypothetical protein H0486_04590 [Lachnospiraceae bacterium MD1]|jgi:hypothetical protein|uniref:Wadjet protein JetD C-terminal domain-containing protein n=1 Tax=Variimorphobacter saccharofermentans TaxID=2755051 RepID=A0A839JYU1_9FIRM|nr:Wadjet anti-phage system protein JetD domain-containing protein [Variimorphobacter saccharofermentans]MBB2182152.1 hypothetical protein [Variimorphobacter saccharofermentans]MEE1247672.1 DUF2220 family protein [Lachnospiraceae bacterium]
MVQYDKQVINKLLDTYENSLLSIGKNKRNVKIELRFTRTVLPEYFDESSFVYENIHIQMRNLEEEGLVRIVWKDQKVDYVIQKVQLNMERLTQAYAFVRRTPKCNLEEANQALLEEYCNGEKGEIPITREFARYLQERLNNHQPVKEYIELSNIKDTRRLFEALLSVEKNRKPCYIREFSIEHFQDSKYFERIKNQVAKIFRRFHSEYDSMDTTEILAEYGIYHTPNYVYLKGDVMVMIDGEPIKLRTLNQGLGISGEDLRKVTFSDLSRIKQVITIENLTTFFRWHEPDSLIIYLGGYHNGIRRTLLKKIYQELPRISYYHFGDIDAGGFSILKDLRNKTGIPFQMYHMDIETLKYYERYGKVLTESDRMRLKEMEKDEELQEVVSYMLLHNVKLEQECVGLERDFYSKIEPEN